MKVFCIIVTYNSQKWIEKNISSIYNNTLGNELEVDLMIVDNGSEDDTIKIVRQIFHKVQIIENSRNLGFAKANNMAFDYALKNNYDYVFLVNHDGWLLSGFWENVLPVLRNNKDFGLLSPFHYDVSEKEYDFSFKEYLPQNYNEGRNPIEISAINAAFLFISKDCLIAVKGFDPIFFFYGEDVDLCFRAKKKGFKIGLIKNAKVVHDRKERPMTKDRLYEHIIANILIQIKSNNENKYFLKTYSKAIYSSIILIFKKNNYYKNVSILYLRSIFHLLLNYRKIHQSCKTY